MFWICGRQPCRINADINPPIEVIEEKADAYFAAELSGEDLAEEAGGATLLFAELSGEDFAEEAGDQFRDFAEKVGEKAAMDLLPGVDKFRLQYRSYNAISKFIFQEIKDCIQQMRKDELSFCETSAVTNFMRALCKELRLPLHISPTSQGELDIHGCIHAIAHSYMRLYIDGQADYNKYYT